MSSQSILGEALNAYDDSSFIREDDSRREQEGDSTRQPDFPPATDRGFNFQPFKVERRDPKVNQLPQEPLYLFQHFVPLSLVSSWAEYTNSWVNSLQERGIIDSQNHELREGSRLQEWKPTSAAELYVWLGILIYIGIHKEIAIEDHWKTPELADQRPEHSIIKFMTYKRFQLLRRHLRPFDYTKFEDDERFPEVFQCAQPWSEHIQYATTQLCGPGSHLAVDEGMIRYTGRNTEVTYVPGKPTDTGFKVWVVAQLGIFLRWIWHQPGARYGPVGIERTARRRTVAQRERSGRGRGGRGRGRERGRQQREAREADKVEEVIHVLTDDGDKVIALNSTQSVVIALINLLPQSIYHVFVDNLFSSPDLFLSLRHHGHGATGTARPNCGIYKELANYKTKGQSGKSGFKFNEIRVVPTPDNQVGTLDTLGYVSLTNMPAYPIGEPNRMEG